MMTETLNERISQRMYRGWKDTWAVKAAVETQAPRTHLKTWA